MNKTILDPSCGRGEFLVEAARRMIAAGCTCVLDRIHAADSSEFNLRITKKRLEHLAISAGNQTVLEFTNVIHYNTISDLRNKIDDMKFDVVVGNPPYQNREENSDSSHWLKFVNISMENLSDNGKLAFISPTSWVGKVTNTSKANWSVFTDNHVELYKPLSDEEKRKHFGTVGSSFGYYIISRGQGPTKLIFDNNSTVMHQLVPSEPLPSLFNPVSFSIHQKIANVTKFKFIANFKFHSQVLKKKSLVSDKKHNQFKHKTYYSHNLIRYTSETQGIYPDIKVMIPIVGTLSNAWTDSNCNLTEDVRYIIVDTQTQANNLLNIIKSRFYRYIGTVYRSGRNLGMALNVLPEMSFDNSVTDLDIYKYFNLTQEEINYIESIVN